ncbi:MAG: amidohydrolase [bacterium]
MSILIKNILLLDGKKRDIYIEENIIKKIGEGLNLPADKTIDGKNKLAQPSFINSHTHSAMTLLRGYADDMPLLQWLSTKIWPIEAKMEEEDVYWGAKLACLEMIRNGITTFNDMYWHFSGTAKATEEMGMRGIVSAVFIDMFNKEKAKEQIGLNENLFREAKRYSNRIAFALGPHAIYTVSEGSLRWASNFSKENNVFIHIHLSETEKEVRDCIEKHNLRPVEYLEKIGFLSERVIACHCVWLSEKEIDILKEYKVKCVFNPISNMKLCVGKVFPHFNLKEVGIPCLLGTDGASSNNSLNMFEAMKIGSLLFKFSSNDPTALKAERAFDMATINPAIGFNINTGKIEEGMLADITIIDIERPEFTPGYNPISDLVYSANPSCVDTVICDGRILMENKRINGESEIIEKAREVAFNLTKRKL